jgi:hypothetical protein
MEVEQGKPMYRRTMTTGLRIQIGVLGLSLWFLASPNAMGFDYPLQEEHVREAYFLGRTTDGEKLNNFYKQYVHDLPFPSRGPYFSYVESVEFRTPYENIVSRSRQHLNQYSSLEAEKDYRADPGLVIVRVLISYKVNYAGPILPDSSFKIHVSQADLIEPKKSTIEHICTLQDDCGVTKFAVFCGLTRSNSHLTRQKLK